MKKNRPSPWPCRILLIDENDSFLDSLTHWFEGSDKIEIIGRAHSNTETLIRVAHLEPDLVLLDTLLPEEGGFDVLRMIKTNWSSVLVVMMAFHDWISIRSAAESGGANGCIAKTDVAENLVHLVTRLVELQGVEAPAETAESTKWSVFVPGQPKPVQVSPSNCRSKNP